MRYQPNQEIVYADKLRYTYTTLLERIQRLANVLTAAGVKPGDTVALLDWDSHRALECFFAVPMLGAVLHTVNVRLSTEQVRYTMNHAEDRLVLVHDDFLPLMAQLREDLPTVEGFIRLGDGGPVMQGVPLLGEYEALLAAAEPQFDFADFDEHSLATLFYTSGTTGNPKGVYFSHRQLVLHTWSSRAPRLPVGRCRYCAAATSTCPSRRCSTCMPWACPMWLRRWASSRSIPGATSPIAWCVCTATRA